MPKSITVCSAHPVRVCPFGVDLTAHSDNVSVYQLYHLGEIGLNDLETLDLIHSVAIFGWANCLMHTLGEPHRKE